MRIRSIQRTINLFYEAVLVLSILKLMALACAQTPEVPVSQDEGLIGILLTQRDDLTLVYWVCPDSPAAQDGRLHSGDVILAVSPDGTDTGFVSIKGMATQDVAWMLRGTPGSAVAMKVRLKSWGDAETEATIRLRRTEMIGTQLQGTVAYGFRSTNYIFLKFTPEEVRGLRRVATPEWSQITNGMTAGDVIRRIGGPVRIMRSHDGENTWWDYGCLTYFRGKALEQVDLAALWLTNGVVARTFDIRLNPHEDIRAEILSKPSAR